MGYAKPVWPFSAHSFSHRSFQVEMFSAFLAVKECANDVCQGKAPLILQPHSTNGEVDKRREK